MSHSVCPWWLGYLLASPLRRLMHDPRKILAPFVREGMRVLEPGPGMGFFTIDLARMVGPLGRIVVVDIQPKMLNSLKRRATKAGLVERLDIRVTEPGSMGVADLSGTIEFVLAFAVVHEMPSSDTFFKEAATTMKPGASMLLVEPAGHVTSELFGAELAAAARFNLKVAERPAIRRSHTALMTKV